ncbi:uncharacterized protein LOC111711609 [Eurytemora carolleeae]|uniref:uncharacterized protein LOC111711609 n=1 Tax=Eurytemora carolleeae TaxID=1294199 RepID=UPI000C78873F|nr:uncharacterized protein LOC111711609 [Eurytemora carolleeae]|eukprot:XP_023341774.1 uncharacterized protein LOC111711609 [Eurytemora affinis]
MMDRIQYKDMYGSLEYTRLVYYRCKVCEAPLIFSFEEIGFHVKEHHSLDIQDYEIQYNAFESDDKIGSKLEVRTSSKYSIGEEERIYSSSLDDMCLFKCQVCDKILYHSLLAKHISKVHNSSKLENLGNKLEQRDNLTLQVERLTYYQCKLCPAQIIFTIAGIHSHLKLTHYISIQEYAVKYKGFDPNNSTQPLPRNYQKTSLLQNHLTEGSIR